MKYLLLVLIFSLNMVSQNLLPLQLGNKWIYEDENKHLYEVKIDTVININGVEYYNCSKSNKIGNLLYRLREDGYYVDRTNSDTTEHEYYKERANIGDIWYYPPDPNLEGFIPSAEVRDTVTAKIFGKYVKIKILYYDAGLIARYRYYTDEFGMLLDSIVPFDDVVARLKGCVIDGVAYGDTSLISGIVDGDYDLTTEYALYQNYPNPFNPYTTVKFKLPTETHIVINVFNSLGEKIKTLYEGIKTGGEHSAIFDGADLPSGSYFVQMVSVNFQKTIKTLLMK